MKMPNTADRRHTWMTILGFACALGFLFSVFYGGANQVAALGTVTLERARTLCVMIFMIGSFAWVVASSASGKKRFRAFAPLVVLSLFPITGLFVTVGFTGELWAVIIEGAAYGVPAALLLCAWGRVLGGQQIERSVPIAFIAAAFGAICVFVIWILIPAVDQLAFAIFPFVSVMFLNASCAFAHTEKAASVVGGQPLPAMESSMSDTALRLSGRIMCGTAAFGFAAGLVEAFGIASGNSQNEQLTYALLIFTFFCLAVLQLFGAAPLAGVKSVLPKFNEHAEDDGPIDGAYRLAILLLLGGLLAVQVLSAVGLPGETIVAAGYLGLITVLVALFLVMGAIGSGDASYVFARGFSILFAGEVVGIIVGNALSEWEFSAAMGVILAVAGILIAYAYLFLFTDRDLRSLSVVLEDTDTFECACERIIAKFALSKRESEILPLALRGRTSERIASEFYITKNTVDTHMRRIYSKCGVSSRQELIDLGESFQRGERSSL